MADKRMFAKSIIESDPFMDMPAEAQMLYIHLNLAADDDGFVDRPRSVMRACGASNDSMKLLIAKKFVLAFDRNDNFIVVVKHWKMHNYIRKDTYRETKYKEFMRELYYDENQSYSLNPGDGHVPCIPCGSPAPVTNPSQPCDAPVTNPSQPCDEPVTNPSRTRDEPLTQDRIGKDSIDKVSLDQGSIGKGECERENPPAPSPASAEKPPSPVLTDEERRIRILHWKHSVEIFRQQKYDPGRIYDLAAAEGITQEEIDNFKENGA